MGVERLLLALGSGFCPSWGTSCCPPGTCLPLDGSGGGGL